MKPCQNDKYIEKANQESADEMFKRLIEKDWGYLLSFIKRRLGYSLDTNYDIVKWGFLKEPEIKRLQIMTEMEKAFKDADDVNDIRGYCPVCGSYGICGH
jgi:hypothetical protein